MWPKTLIFVKHHLYYNAIESYRYSTYLEGALDNFLKNVYVGNLVASIVCKMLVQTTPPLYVVISSHFIAWRRLA